MSVNYNESYPIKSEVIVKETFSYCGKFEDYGDEEFKKEPIDFEASVKSEVENNSLGHTDIHDVSIHQYICNECNFITTEKYSLIEHLKISNNVQYSCKALQTLPAQLHTPKNGDECIYKKCDCKTSREHDFKTHMKIHTVNKYKCNECDYKTLGRGWLKNHMKIHTGEEYKCNECHFKVVRKYDLNMHMKIHTGNEYKCDECDYKTLKKGYLEKHIKVHNGYLKRHMKIHNGKQYKCNECDYKTLIKGYLKKHMKIRSGNEYKCNECDYKTLRKGCFKNHMKIHTGNKEY
ncbi:hypothetical protein FQA39_LY00957 [Lamprigera yunnana]|nr:hypothetical protein FQA39_LY00957 [Lamprigera yunnana]